MSKTRLSTRGNSIDYHNNSAYSLRVNMNGRVLELLACLMEIIHLSSMSSPKILFRLNHTTAVIYFIESFQNIFVFNNYTEFSKDSLFGIYAGLKRKRNV